jgi:hypothetical protein
MLPFTAEILFSDFAQYNRAIWPLPVLAWGLGLAAVLLTLRPLRGGNVMIGALLAAAWLWTGIGYHILHFATINFAAPIYGAFFALEGLLFAWSGVLRQTLSFRFRPDLFGWAGLVLALAALTLWPLADWLEGYGAGGMRVVGLAPTPTAAFTLGLLLLTAGRVPLRLAIVPLLWALVAGATAWILGIAQDLALPAAGLGALCLMLWKNRRRR